MHRVRSKLKVMEAKKAEKLTLIVSNRKPLKLCWKTSHVYEMKAALMALILSLRLLGF